MNPLRRFVIHLTLGTSLLGGLMFEGPPVLSAATFTCTAGDVGCLIASMGKANVSPDHDYLLLQPGTYVLTKPDNTSPRDAISAETPNGLPVNTGALTIVGTGGQGRTLITRAEGAPAFRLIENAPTGGLTIAGVTLSNGDSVAMYTVRLGGCIRNQGSMMLIQSTVRECAAHQGGGIYSDGELLVQQSVIVENYAYLLCGGIDAKGPTEIRSTWIGENAAYHGGGMCGGEALVTIRNSVIDGNVATETSGGGIRSGGPLEITRSLLSDNLARRFGGGLAVSGEVTLTQSTLWENNSREDGGGLAVTDGEAHLTDVAVLFNHAGMPTASTVGRPGRGGGIATYGDALVTLERAWLLWNEASEGAECSGNVQLEGWAVIGDAGRFHPQDEAACQ